MDVRIAFTHTLQIGKRTLWGWGGGGGGRERGGGGGRGGKRRRKGMEGTTGKGGRK